MYLSVDKNISEAGATNNMIYFNLLILVISKCIFTISLIKNSFLLPFFK